MLSAGKAERSAAPAAPSAQAVIAIKRAYDPPSRSDGSRVLVDRLWPRGIRKPDLRLARWMREVAPSDELRRFFGHDPARWSAFRKRYLTELGSADMAQAIGELLEMARGGKLTLVYGARDPLHNQAVVLKELLERKLRKR
ncbi:MAG TPA: DUF488 domain-containing protein [Candidatus Binataceae bacterium]|nr:DUF488 domain-containing protein [Candidatus Binataceae bacterium]